MVCSIAPCDKTEDIELVGLNGNDLIRRRVLTMKYPAQMLKLAARPTQNQGVQIDDTPPLMSGLMGPGPILFGAQARATMVATDPRTCADRSVKATWTRVSVARRIIPSPTP